MVDLDGALYACTFESRRLRVRLFRFEGGRFRPVWREPRDIEVGDLSAEDLVVLGVRGGVEIWRDDADRVERVARMVGGRTVPALAALAPRPAGDLVFSSGDMLGFKDDRGVSGQFITVADLASQRSWRVRARHVFAAGERVLAVAVGDPHRTPVRHGLHVFDGVRKSFLETDGPVLEAGGCSARIVLSVFTGDDAGLREVSENADGRLEVHCIAAPEGYKALSPDGGTYTVRGFEEALTVATVPRADMRCGARPGVFGRAGSARAGRLGKIRDIAHRYRAERDSGSSSRRPGGIRGTGTASVRAPAVVQRARCGLGWRQLPRVSDARPA